MKAREHNRPGDRPPRPLRFLARLAGADGSPAFEQSGVLTEYTAQTLVEETKRAGSGTRLELSVPANTAPSDLRWIAHSLGALLRRGIRVRVRRDRSLAWVRACET
jgi:hypothetical protein